MKKMFLSATAVALVLAATAASAQQGGSPPPDPNGYYNQSDPNGYYDRNGNYVRTGGQSQDQGQPQGDNGPPPDQGYNGPPPDQGYNGPPPDQGYNGPPPDQGYNGPPPGPGYYGPPPRRYHEGDYEDSCRRDNNTAGTLFGMLAGGLIGSAASHGNGGAVVGGAILGGIFGNAVTHDMPCEDHPYAFRVYAQGLDGDIGHRYEWRHGDDYGYFVPENEFHRGGYICRSFTETTYRGGHSYNHSGSACRMGDGNWRFD